MERYQNNIQDLLGNAVGAVTVTVRRVSDGNLASIFSDNSLTVKSNPFTNDADGEFFFYAGNTRYNIFFTGPITDQKDDVLLFDTVDAPAPSGGRINTDIATATPPTTETVTGNFEIYDLDDDDLLAQFGFNAQAFLHITNYMRSGGLVVTCIDAAGADKTILTGDPDGITTIRADTDLILQVATGETTAIGRANGGFETFYDFDKRTTTAVDGAFDILSDGDTDAEDRFLRLTHQDGTVRSQIGHFAASGTTVFFTNQVHGGDTAIAGEDAGGSPRTFFNGDPDGETTVRADSDIRFQVFGAQTACIMEAFGPVSLYYSNKVNLRTSADVGGGAGMGGEVRHANQTFYPVGMNVLPIIADIDTGDETLAPDNIGFMIVYNTATNRELNFPDDSNIQVYSMWGLIVGPSAGVLTGDGETGVQIRWWNGSSWTTTASAGNITIGEGQYSIWKQTDGFYYISGPNLS